MLFSRATTATKEASVPAPAGACPPENSTADQRENTQWGEQGGLRNTSANGSHAPALPSKMIVAFQLRRELMRHTVLV